jgi:Domain of unknown function (DUF5668)
MSDYIPNRACSCARCRARGLTGAVVLITLGVLFLLQNYLYIDFGQTWPALLIVIGLVTYAGHSASIAGHIDPRGIAGAPPPAADRGPDQSGPEVHS